MADRLDYDNLLKLLSENIVELTFIKRTDGSHRRMFCTNCRSFLNSIPAEIAMHFKPPKGYRLPYDPRAKNLIVTWDIMMQDYRQIPVESHNIVEGGVYPVLKEEDVARFWEFFANYLQNMSPTEMLQFTRK